MQSEHYCNGTTDPAICCPVAHGHPTEFCTCKVSEPLAKAARNLLHELHLEKFRINGVLYKHRVSKAIDAYGKEYASVDCLDHRASGPLESDNICWACKEKVDCVN